jgi:hypothetical protein
VYNQIWEQLLAKHSRIAKNQSLAKCHISAPKCKPNKTGKQAEQRREIKRESTKNRLKGAKSMKPYYSLLSQGETRGNEMRADMWDSLSATTKKHIAFFFRKIRYRLSLIRG